MDFYFELRTFGVWNQGDATILHTPTPAPVDDVITLLLLFLSLSLSLCRLLVYSSLSNNLFFKVSVFYVKKPNQV